MTDEEFEARVARFEDAWRRGGPAEIGDHLGGPPDPSRDRLLVELICIDLEYRWRGVGSTTPAGLAGYLAKFPALVSLDRLPLELIGEDYRARHRWGDRPTHDAFLAAFRERREQIRAELARIDEEIAGEAAGLGADAGPPPGGGDPTTPAVAGLGVPLLSDRDFLLRRLIGAGRMGKVYRATRRADGCEVAAKFLRKSLLNRPEVVRRFLGEARTVAELRHPNVVATQGLGRTSGGSYFLVMDLVQGPDLARLIGGRAVGWAEAIGWSIEVSDALAHAHERGIVHCDLKPANILLDRSGRIQVADFGLARTLDGDGARAGDVEGTAPFMAPEQVCRSWGPIDARTDVYGLGATLFALLTGRAPHVGRGLPKILGRVAAPDPVVAADRLRADLPGPLVDLLRTCLAKPPGARYGTAREVRSALIALRESSHSGPDGG